MKPALKNPLTHKELAQLRADYANLTLHKIWLKAGVPSVVKYIPNENSLMASLERITRFGLNELNARWAEGSQP